MVWKAPSSSEPSPSGKAAPRPFGLGFLSTSMISEEREEYWKILMLLLLSLVGGDSRFRLAISTMLTSLLAHLGWARRMIRGGLAWSLVPASLVDEAFSCVAESFEMTFVAFAEIWVLDWIERRVMVWVSERAVSSNGILFGLVVVDVVRYFTSLSRAV